MELFVIFFSAVLINNFVLIQFLGICPFLGVSKKLDTAIGMTFAVAFVMTIAAVVSYFVNIYLVRFGIAYMRTVAFILVIAALVQIVEMIVEKVSPPLYQALGIYLPLITTNCAVMGMALLAVNKEYNLLQTAIFGFASAVGFGLAIIIFASIRERLDYFKSIPKSFQGAAIALVTAGFLSLSFMAFSAFKTEVMLNDIQGVFKALMGL